jgi:hypothetical protein
VIFRSYKSNKTFYRGKKQMQMFNSEYLQEKWAPILDYQGMDQIKDSHRRAVTAILLENQERELT